MDFLIAFLIIFGLPLFFVILFALEKIFKLKFIKTEKQYDPYLDDIFM